MSGLAAVNRFLSLYIGAFKLIFRARAWAALLAYALVCWLLLYMLYDLSVPAFHAFATWWVAVLDKIFGTDDAFLFFRFPDHLMLLADKFGWAKTVVGLFLESLVLGATARTMALMIRGRSAAGDSKPLLSLWVHLGLAWLIVNLLTITLGNLIPDLLPFLTRSTKRLLFLQVIVLPGCFTAIFSLFVFVVPSIGVFNDSIRAAISRSLRIFISHPLTCFAMAGSILALPMLFSILSGYDALLMDRFRPELIYWILVAGLFAELVANFFWMAVAVRFLLTQDE